MKSFDEYMNESLSKNINIIQNDKDSVTDDNAYSYIQQYASPKIKASDAPYYIGTLGYKTSGKTVWYEMFDLDDFDKKEFVGKGIFGFSSKNMVHQTRILGQIRGDKLYFLDNDQYENDNKVVFNGRGIKIDFINVKNKKYYDKLGSMI